MNIKKIIKEETNNFDWIKDIEVSNYDGHPQGVVWLRSHSEVTEFFDILDRYNSKSQPYPRDNFHEVMDSILDDAEQDGYEGIISISFFVIKRYPDMLTSGYWDYGVDGDTVSDWLDDGTTFNDDYEIYYNFKDFKSLFKAVMNESEFDWIDDISITVEDTSSLSVGDIVMVTNTEYNTHSIPPTCLPIIGEVLFSELGDVLLKLEGDCKDISDCSTIYRDELEMFYGDDESVITDFKKLEDVMKTGKCRWLFTGDGEVELVKRPLKEQDEFDWIRDIKPRADDEINVGDYFYIIDNYTGQFKKGEEYKATKIRYMIKIVDIIEHDGRELVMYPLLDRDDLKNGIETLYMEDSGEVIDENDLPVWDEINIGDSVTLDKAKDLIRTNYWRYTEDPFETFQMIEGMD